MYKVVRECEDGLLKSAWVRGGRQLCLTYPLDKWVSPKMEGTKIFVFNDIKPAISFIKHISDRVFNLKVYEYHVLNPSYEYDLYAPNIRSFDLLNHLDIDYIARYSDGKPAWTTVYCDAVKLFGEPVYENPY